MKYERTFRSVFNTKILDKLIFIYFSYFKKIFKKDIFEYSIGMHFHNFILKFIKKINTQVIGKKNLDYFIIFDDIKFIVRNSLIYYNLLRYGEHESASSYIFNHLVKKNMIVLDIGGNIGHFSLLASKLVGMHGKVYVFEPDPTSFKYLRKNVEINKIGNVILVNKCVSNEERILTLYHHPKFHSCHSIFKPDSKKPVNYVDVESIKLDNMFSDKNFKISFIKLDIEGAEINALKGMGKMLEKMKVPYLLTECNLRILRERGEDAQVLILELDKYFNRYYVIKDDRYLIFELFTDKDILINYLNSLNQNNLNILCIR